MSIDPKEKIKLVMHNYFKKHEISYTHYPEGSMDFEYLIVKHFKTYNILIKEFDISGNQMVLTLKEKEFLEKDERNQICLVTSMSIMKPRVLAFLTFEKEEEDKKEEIRKLKQENLMLKMDLKMLESRLIFRDRVNEITDKHITQMER